MRRSVLATVLIATFVFSLAPSVSSDETSPEAIKVMIDGLPVALDVPPLLQKGRTLVPFRALAEALNVDVSWEGGTQTVRASDLETEVTLQIGSKTAYRNGIPISLDVAPVILEGRTLIPLRFFSEAYGCGVEWDEAAKAVRITSPPREMTVIGFYALGDKTRSSWTDLFGVPYPERGTGKTRVISELALGWYSMDKDGNLLTRSSTGWQRPDGWEKVLEAAGEYGLNTEMVVHVTDGDGRISDMLKNGPAVNRFVEAALDESGMYDGVNLDFEGLGYTDEGAELEAVRGRFTGLVRLLSEGLKAAGKTLTVTLHPPNSAYRGYDYEALGRLADRIVVMAYEYGSTPEPVHLVVEAVDMAAAEVPPEKLVLGISVPTETPESVETKIGIAKRYGLAGIAVWRLGVIGEETWQTFQGTIKPR